jgi:hypothetical protein
MNGAAEGWAAQRLGLPYWWYQHIAASTGLEFPISGDATRQHHEDACHCLTEEPPC